VKVSQQFVNQNPENQHKSGYPYINPETRKIRKNPKALGDRIPVSFRQFSREKALWENDAYLKLKK
jgi:hypothetical protein